VEEAKQRLKSSTGNNSSVLHFVVCSSGLNNEIMTPKEKGKKLVLEFEQKLYGCSVTDGKWAKCVEASLLCVDKQLELINLINNDGADDYYEEILQIREAIDEM
jgi:hypothetical protein